MAQESCAIILPQFIAVCVIALRQGSVGSCPWVLYGFFFQLFPRREVLVSIKP